MSLDSSHFTPCPPADVPAPFCSALRDVPVVIVGGGPVGLTAAAGLAHRGVRVTILERSTDPAAVNKSRNYTVIITPRGNRIIDSIPNLQLCVRKRGVEAPEFHYFTMHPSGHTIETKSPPRADGTTMTFIGRGEYVAALLDYINTECSGVTVLRGTAVESASFNLNGNTELHVRDADGAKGTIRARLVLACDGTNSAVVRQLRDGASSTALNSSAGFADQAFEVLSSKMRVKSVVVHPALRNRIAATANGPRTEPVDTKKIPELPPTVGTAIVGGISPYFRLSILPTSTDVIKARDGVAAMVVTSPKACVFDARTTEEGYDKLQRYCPHVNLREYITEQSMRQFVEAGDGWAFGLVRRTASLVAYVGSKPDDDAGGSVIVLGDAAQSAPPDLGQGLNSGLEDVDAFLAVLDTTNATTPLGEIARQYEQMRSPDIDGLMYLNRSCAILQANPNTLQARIYYMGARWRRRLANLMPRWIHPPMVAMLKAGMSYSEMQRRASVTTGRIWTAISLTVVGVVGSATMLAVRNGVFQRTSKGLRDVLYNM